MKEGASGPQKRKEKKFFVLRKSWNKDKNLSSLDLTEKCFSLQIILLIHFNTKSIYCGPHLIH